MDVQQFETRKQDHIRHALDPANQAGASTGFDRVHLVHEALPEIDFSEVTLESTSFGEKTRTPLFVPGMTAGHQDGASLNLLLAAACQERGWVLGVGSQRRDLDGAGTSEWTEFKRKFPRLISIGNIGISQIIHSKTDAILRLSDAMGSRALAVHLNALQECLQPEGTPQFRGALSALERLCKASDRPILVKETGCGFSQSTLKKISQVGVAAIDLSGRGGTHWGRIEGRRAGSGTLQSEAAETFASWGESTVDSLIAARAAGEASKGPTGLPAIWASGGLRSGLDAAKALALGAERAGLAQPALRAALSGEQALDRWMTQIEFELKLALFCTGCSRPEDLRNKPESWTWKTT